MGYVESPKFFLVLEKSLGDNLVLLQWWNMLISNNLINQKTLSGLDYTGFHFGLYSKEPLIKS